MGLAPEKLDVAMPRWAHLVHCYYCGGYLSAGNARCLSGMLAAREQERGTCLCNRSVGDVLLHVQGVHACLGGAKGSNCLSTPLKERRNTG